MTVSSPSSTLTKGSLDSIERSAKSTSVSSAARASQVSASIYKIDHQVKYLHLQAETDALLQQLQLLQQTRQA